MNASRSERPSVKSSRNEKRVGERDDVDVGGKLRKDRIQEVERKLQVRV